MEEIPQDSTGHSLQCRLCLQDGDLMVHVFGERGREADMYKKLYIHLNLEVKEDDILSKHMCLNCWQTVDCFDTFFHEVGQNQALLASGTDATDGGSTKELQIQYLVDGDELAEANVDNFELLQSTEALSTSPPSYDEAQKRKQTKTNPSHMSDCANIEGDTIEMIESVTVLEQDNVSTILPDDGVSDLHETNSNGESDEEDVFEDVQTVDESKEPLTEGPGILVQVNDYRFPQIIRNGRMIVRGEQLDKCLVAHYGLACSICKQQDWTTMDELFAHQQAVHKEQGFVTCCGKKIVKRILIAMHMAKHVQPEAFECQICKKMMTTPRILKYHMQNHLPEKERPLKCKLCPRRFSYVSGLLIHVSKHRLENNEKRAYYICDLCGRAYGSEKRLAEHVSNSHDSDEPRGNTSHCVSCDTCGRTFVSKSNLNYHMTTHQANVHQVQCEHCGKWLKNKLCLRKHMLQHSSVRHRCTLCDYSTTNVQSLQNHQRVKHTDIKPYECGTCGKTFKLKGNLREHLAQHKDYKQYSCEFCSRQFTSKSNYYAHRKRMHSSELERQRRLKENEARANRIKFKLQ